jgi:hypothetical protein
MGQRAKTLAFQQFFDDFTPSEVYYFLANNPKSGILLKIVHMMKGPL